MAKLLLVLALLLLAGGMGVAQRNTPQVTQHPNITNITVEWMKLTSFSYRVCDDEEPSVIYSFRVHFHPDNALMKITKRCNERFADFLQNGYACSRSLQFNVDNQSCHEITIGAWNARGYDTLCISIDILYRFTPESNPIPVSYDSDFILTFPPSPTPSVTFPTDTVAPSTVTTTSTPNAVSGNTERDHAVCISVPVAIVGAGVLFVVIIMIILCIYIQKNKKPNKIDTSCDKCKKNETVASNVTSQVKL